MIYLVFPSLYQAHDLQQWPTVEEEMQKNNTLVQIIAVEIKLNFIGSIYFSIQLPTTTAKTGNSCKNTFSSDTRQSMKRRIIAKQLTEPN